MVKSKAKHSHLVDCPKEITIGAVIVSSSRYKELQEGKPLSDKSLPVFRKVFGKPSFLDTDAKYILKFEKIIPDDPSQIEKIIKDFAILDKIHVLIFSGGTGITKKDITIETVIPFFDKEMPGFGEVFRHLSYNDIGNSTILSRATAGVINNTIVFLIPGSSGAVKTALEDIIQPELPHVLSEIYREINRSKAK